MTSRPLQRCAWLLSLCCVLSVSSVGLAQHIEGREYIVARGETLGEIAENLHVSVRDLAEANHLHEPYLLRHDRRLRLPSNVSEDLIRQYGGSPAPRNSSTSQGTTAANARVQTGSRTPPTSSGTGARNPPTHTSRYRPPLRTRWGIPAAPGFVRLIRESTGVQQSVALRRVGPRVLGIMRSFLRSNNGNTRAINPELLRKLARVSDHFGGRRIHVISGYRPFRRGQWTAHSNHNFGRAMDFRVEGVPNRLLRDFCRTIPMTGCGYYPRSVFVHMDVRSESAYWVDWSRPGQRPIYGREDRPPTPHAAGTPTPPTGHSGGEDEGVDDVAQDSPRVRAATSVEVNDDDTRAHNEEPVLGAPPNNTTQQTNNTQSAPQGASQTPTPGTPTPPAETH